MDEIQIYNYLNKVKPFFKRQEETVTEVTGGTKYSGCNAYATRHCDTLRLTVGGVYKASGRKIDSSPHIPYSHASVLK